MSWNWNADEEKKEYETKGTVTISTEEYRDLIESVQKLKAAGQKEHDDWYEEYNNRKKAEEELKKRDELIAKYREYVSSSESRKASYLTWCEEKKREQLAESEEFDD